MFVKNTLGCIVSLIEGIFLLGSLTLTKLTLFSLSLGGLSSLLLHLFGQPKGSEGGSEEAWRPGCPELSCREAGVDLALVFVHALTPHVLDMYYGINYRLLPSDSMEATFFSHSGSTNLGSWDPGRLLGLRQLNTSPRAVHEPCQTTPKTRFWRPRELPILHDRATH
jgi:hypothetical protein